LLKTIKKMRIFNNKLLYLGNDRRPAVWHIVTVED